MPQTSTATTSTDPVIWDGLRPRNVVQAAQEDMRRRRRNERRADPEYNWAEEERYEQYAFLREHVKAADGAFGLIQLALDAVVADPIHDEHDESSLRSKLLKSTKRHMKHLYTRPLLRAALELEK